MVVSWYYVGNENVNINGSYWYKNDRNQNIEQD